MRYTPISELYRQVRERKLTPQEIEDREKIAKKLPMDDFKKRYGKEKGMQVKMATATNIVKAKSEVKEDGHQDVASAIRQCKTVTEDAMQILQKLKSMSPEDSLPSWWTNKLAVASNSMNKLRDYFLVPSVSEEVELDEKAGDVSDMEKLIGELQNASKMHLAQSKRVKAHVDMMKGSKDLETIVGELEKASQAHLRQSKTIDAHIKGMDKTEELSDAEKNKIDKIEKKAAARKEYQDKIKSIRNEEVKLDEAKFSPSMIAKLKKTYEPLKGKKINPNPLMKIFDKIDSNKDGLIQLYKANIPFVSTMAMSRLTLKHNMKADEIKKLREEVELDEQFDFVLLDKDNKIVARASGKNAKKEMESSKKSAHLPPMRIPKNEVGKMKVYPISPKDKKDIGDMVLAIGEEKNHIKEMIQSGKFTRPEIKKMIERNILEQKSATGYTLFHRSFSDAMQHAYAFARVKMGMTVDPKEIDNKVATGPKKPGTGKTNSYSLKTNKGMLQIQVYNTGGGAKPFELNMYSS